MGGGDDGASWKLKKAVKKIFLLLTCGSFCQRQQTHVSPVTVSHDSRNYSSSSLENRKRSISSEIAGQPNSGTSPSSNKNLCLICLDPLNYTSGSRGAKAIFTAQCSHAFHFACITSNVQHGSITCPICRAHWTQLPRNLNTRCPLHNKTENPILRILDDSIANSRIHRRSFLRYDDPIEPDHTGVQTRLSFSLLTSQSFNSCTSPNNGAYLRVKLAHQPATDLVLVAAPNGPRLGLMKQAMALVVSTLRPIDRLVIVACSSAGAPACTFRRMTSYGKRITLKNIDKLFYTSQANPTEDLEKGVKILEERVHKNPQSCILHLTDAPSRSYNHWCDMEVPVTIRRFHFGSGFGGCNGFIMREFEEFLTRTLGGRVEDIQLRIGERMMVVRIGELRGGEERNVPLRVGKSGRISLKYSYRDGGDGECVKTGDVVVGVEEDKGDGTDNRYDVPIGARMSSAGNWDYHDPFLARRWARHLHRL